MTLQMGPWLSTGELGEVIRAGAAGVAGDRLLASLGPRGSFTTHGDPVAGFIVRALVGDRVVATGTAGTRHGAINHAHAFVVGI